MDESPGMHVYERLANRTVDLNFEMWPANYMEVRSTSLKKATYMGKLDYSGRAGWFVPRLSLRNADAHWGVLHDNGSHIETREHQLDPWRGIFPLFDYEHMYSQLMRTDQLPAPAESCSMQADVVQPPYGRYACAEGTWYPTDGRCCPRGHTCASSVSPCRALYVSNPTYDFGKNEEAIQISGLPLQILYGSGLEAAVQSAEEAGQPLLVHAWEPDPLVSEDRFIRVDLTPDYYCDAAKTHIHL